MRCQGEGKTSSICASSGTQTFLLSDIHPPSSFPLLGGRSCGSASILGGHGEGSWLLATREAPPTPPTPPSTNKREKNSAGKEGRQVLLLSGSLVSMATGSALLQLLTPQSLCHPIFS